MCIRDSYMGLPYDLIHKTPADGLTGKSDEENFGSGICLYPPRTMTFMSRWRKGTTTR